MVDGLGNGLEQAGSSSIAAGAVGTSEIEDLSVATADLAAEAVTAAKQSFVGTGSPTGYGLSIQTGSFQASNVAVTASFGTAFAAAPTYVTVSLLSSGAAATQPGMVTGISAGSFTALGQSGLDYAYVAVGSGAI